MPRRAALRLIGALCAAVKRIPGISKSDNRLVSGEQIGWD
jgi:hypothetical protein